MTNFFGNKHPGSICLVNYKGGVGKTTASLLLGHYLAGKNKKVLLVDVDPQCSLSLAIGMDAAELDRGGNDIYNLMHPKMWTNIATTDFGLFVYNIKTNLDILRGSFSVDELDLEIAKSIPKANDRHENDLFMYCKQVINAYNKYDFVIVDCPPNKMYLTQAMLRASRFYIPITIPDALSIYGMPRLLRWIKAIPDGERPNLLGYILNSVNRKGPSGMTNLQIDNSADLESQVAGELTPQEQAAFTSGPELGRIPRLDVIAAVAGGQLDLPALRKAVSGQPTPDQCMRDIRDEVLSRVAVLSAGP